MEHDVDLNCILKTCVPNNHLVLSYYHYYVPYVYPLSSLKFRTKAAFSSLEGKLNIYEKVGKDTPAILNVFNQAT
jgi:hypothetical protein